MYSNRSALVLIEVIRAIRWHTYVHFNSLIQRITHCQRRISIILNNKPLFIKCTQLMVIRKCIKTITHLPVIIVSLIMLHNITNIVTEFVDFV